MKLELHVHNHPSPLETEILNAVLRLEQKMATQNEAIQKFVDDATVAFEAINVSLANVQADEANLLAEIEALKASASELTPENVAKLDSVASLAASVSDRLKAVADAVPDPPANV